MNLDLLDLPRELGEFVIVHELVHLLAPNHGKVFKSFMYAYMPDWEKREAALQKYVDWHRRSASNGFLSPRVPVRSGQVPG